MSSTGVKFNHDRPTDEASERETKRVKESTEQNPPARVLATSLSTILQQLECKSKEEVRLSRSILPVAYAEKTGDSGTQDGPEILSSSQTLDYGSDEVPDSTIGKDDSWIDDNEDVGEPGASLAKIKGSSS